MDNDQTYICETCNEKFDDFTSILEAWEVDCEPMCQKCFDAYCEKD